jgi:hypothetical protein
MQVHHMQDMINAQLLWPLAQLMEQLGVKIEHVQMPQQLIIVMIYVRLIFQLEIVLQRMEEDAELIQLVMPLILIQLVQLILTEMFVSGMEHVRQKLVPTHQLPTTLMIYVKPFYHLVQ